VSQVDSALPKALTSALRAIKAEAGDVEEAELRQLLQESKGSVMVNGEAKPFYRYAYAAADYLYGNPDHFTKFSGGTTVADLTNVVSTLLERQVRLDASSGAVIPEAWSAQTLLDRVLERAGKTLPKLRRAQLQAL
jgi:hypothetical protein